jgi:hypothetical protein
VRSTLNEPPSPLADLSASTEPGNSLNIGATSLSATIAILIMLYCKRENRLRDAGKRDHRLEGLNPEEVTALGNRWVGTRNGGDSALTVLPSQ